MQFDKSQAMTTTTQIDPVLLKRIRRLLRQQSDLNSRIRKCPIRVTMSRETETGLETSLAELRDTLKKSRMSADQKQLQLNERETHIEDLKGKRNACNSNREYQLLSDQIAADQQANSVLSDEILELLERVDSLQAEIAEKEKSLVEARVETARLQQIVDEELSRLQSELDEVRVELAEAEGLLPSDVRATVRRLAASIGEDAVAPVEENSCGHCNTKLTTQHVSELSMNQIVWCKSCGSLLYLT